MSSTSSGTATEARCLGCGRRITSAESIAVMRGSGCRAKIRRAVNAADLSAWTPEQIKEAREAIEDGAVVPTNRPDVFHVVSSDGTEVYLTHPDGCNCPNGLRTGPPRPCWHRCAVTIVLAASAPTSRPAPAPVLAAAEADLWAEMDRLTAAFMAFA